MKRRFAKDFVTINIIDATPIEAAQSGPGKGKDGFIHRQTVTAGNIHDSQEYDMRAFRILCQVSHSDVQYFIQTTLKIYSQLRQSQIPVLDGHGPFLGHILYANK